MIGAKRKLPADNIQDTRTGMIRPIPPELSTRQMAIEQSGRSKFVKWSAPSDPSPVPSRTSDTCGTVRRSDGGGDVGGQSKIRDVDRLINYNTAEVQYSATSIGSHYLPSIPLMYKGPRELASADWLILPGLPRTAVWRALSRAYILSIFIYDFADTT